MHPQTWCSDSHWRSLKQLACTVHTWLKYNVPIDFHPSWSCYGHTLDVPMPQIGVMPRHKQQQVRQAVKNGMQSCVWLSRQICHPSQAIFSSTCFKKRTDLKLFVDLYVHQQLEQATRPTKKDLMHSARTRRVRHALCRWMSTRLPPVVYHADYSPEWPKTHRYLGCFRLGFGPFLWWIK